MEGLQQDGGKAEYLGETSRSGFHGEEENSQDLLHLNVTSHMVKHLTKSHPVVYLTCTEYRIAAGHFKMTVEKQHRTAMER